MCFWRSSPFRCATVSGHKCNASVERSLPVKKHRSKRFRSFPGGKGRQPLSQRTCPVEGKIVQTKPREPGVVGHVPLEEARWLLRDAKNPRQAKPLHPRGRIALRAG